MAGPDALDLDPIEPEPEDSRGKGKGPRPAKPAGKPKGRDARDDRDPEPRAPRKSVAGNRKVPYPPSPADVPEGLTDYADSYTKQQNLLLAGLFVFLMFYIGAVLLFAMLGVWCIYAMRGGGGYTLIGLIGSIFSGIFFLFLVKGFFKRPPMNKEMHIEITEEEHPVLFEFIYQLCDELGAPLPNKVYVAPDVNAAVMPRTSLLNLFVEPKKDLLIGLGLVNSVNLSEFKAVLAHEFGHFSQSAMASSYTYVASRIIGDLVEGEDWFDRMVNWCKSQENVFAVVGYVIGAPLWVGRKMLEWFYKAITLQRLAVSREREFHADLVAVSAAGSNAVVHCLLRTEFGHQCFMQALSDLATAIDHKLYSNDLYLHQDRAAAVVRRHKKEPELGLPPALKGPNDGKNIDVFDAEEEEMEDEIPPMWRTHPSNSDREKNAKDQFVPATVDHRSPWILFDDAAELKERMTYKFYRMVFKIPKNADLANAVKVQKFIDNEHADTTYDPKYKGCYDDRPLEPGDLSELNGIIREKPWDEDRMEKVLAKLYDGCEEHAEAHSELYKEMQSLRNSVVGRPSRKMKQKMEEVEKKQDENWEWFKSFDRRVYLLHVQMAAQVDKDLKDGLVERYRFQLEVQRLYQESRNAFNKADAYLGAYSAAARGEINVGPDFAAEVIQVLRESWKALKNIIKDARDINLPAMKNFEEGENLAEFILEGKMVPEPPLSYVKGVWIDKLMTQLQGVRQKCFRLHFKSVGGILKLQEDIATKWKQQREPIAAEVIDVEATEVVPAEVVPAEVVEAEVVPAEIVPAEVVAEEPTAVEVIAAEVIEAEVLPAEQPTAPEPPKSVAAFVAPAPVAPVAPAPSPPLSRPELRSTIPLVPPPASAPAPAPVAQQPIQPQSVAPKSGVTKLEPQPAAPKPVEAPASGSKPMVPAVPAAVAAVAAVTAPFPALAPAAPAAPPKPPISEVEVSGTFSLDSGLPLPAKPKAFAPPPPPPEPKPIEAEVIEAEVIEAEVIPAEVVEAEVIEAEVIPAEVVEAEVIEAQVIEAKPSPAPAKPPVSEVEVSGTFSLDSGLPLPAKPKAYAPPAAPARPVAAEDVFSLDAEEEPAPAPKSAVAKPASAPAKPAAPAPADAVFSLDADEHEDIGFSLDADDNKPAPKSAVVPAPVAKQPASGVVPVPKPSAAPLSATIPIPEPRLEPASGTKPASGKRPPIKITLVKPGERSPLAK